MIEIYALCDPTTKEIRYIGKATNSVKRLKSHIRDSRRRNTPVYCWIRSLMKTNNLPELIVLEVVEDSVWEDAERRLIAQHRANGRVLNVADGGDEPYCSKETRAQNGRKNAKLRTDTPEKEWLFHTKRDLGKLLSGGYVKESTKAKLRLAAFKRPDLFGEWAYI